jgi:hypothetical protein
VKAREERGQAAVELLAGAVVMVLAGLIGLQLLGAGYAAVMADHAARAAALAVVNGRPPEPAARAAVPGWPASALAVTRRGDAVSVRLRTPSPLRVLRRRLSFESTVRLARGRAVP